MPGLETRQNEPPPAEEALNSEWALAVQALWSSEVAPAISELFTPAIRKSPVALEQVLLADLAERQRRELPWHVEDYLGAAPELVQSARLIKQILMAAASAEVFHPARLDQWVDELSKRYPGLRGVVREVGCLAGWLHQTLDMPLTHSQGDRTGKYELLELLGRGAFAETWRARDMVLGRDVALKIIRPKWGEAVNVEQFYREARALALVDHPAVVRIHEASQFAESGEYYLDIQLIGGESKSTTETSANRFQTLNGFLNGRPAEPRRAAQMIATIAAGLGAAHSRGLTHRDIKPSNILLDADQRPVLADFGLAMWGDKSTDDVDQKMGLAGTVSYLAPEVARGEQPNPLADIYSLGATLRAILLGTTPEIPNAEGTSWKELIRVISVWKFPALSKVAPQLPPTLIAICERATSFEPRDRYQTALEMADDLHAFLELRPTRADPLGKLGTTRLWLRRNIRASLLTALLVSIASIAGSAFVWKLGQERNVAMLAEADARRQRDAANAAKEITDLQNAFVTRTFNSARGQHGLGNEGADFTVRDTIQLALSRVNQTFPDKPLVRAAILHFLAQADMAIGENARAMDSAKQALAARQSHLGETDVNTIATQRLIADLLLRDNRREQAIHLCQELENRLNSMGLENSYDGLWVRARLAAEAAGKDRQGRIPVLQKICEAYRELTFSGGMDQQRALGDLVSLYVSDRRFDLAEMVQNEIVELNRTRLGPNDISTLNSLQALALIVRRQGKLPLALELYRQAAAGFELTVGWKHATCQHVQIELASVAQEALAADAGDLAARAWKNCQQLPSSSDKYLRAALVQARAWRSAGDLQLAEKLLSETWTASYNLKGTSRPWAIQIGEELASLLTGLGKEADAALVRAQLK